MKVQVFIRSKKILLRDSLTRAIRGLCTTLSTVIVDKGAGRVARFQSGGKQRSCLRDFFERQRRIFWKFSALPNPRSRAKVSAVLLGERCCLPSSKLPAGRSISFSPCQSSQSRSSSKGS